MRRVLTFLTVIGIRGVKGIADIPLCQPRGGVLFKSFFGKHKKRKKKKDLWALLASSGWDTKAFEVPFHILGPGTECHWSVKKSLLTFARAGQRANNISCGSVKAGVQPGVTGHKRIVMVDNTSSYD